LLTVSAVVTNTGVAPFYAEWPIEIALLGASATHVERSWRTDWKLSRLLPHDAERNWKFQTSLRGISGEHRVALRVQSVPGAKSLRFANREQQPDGWMLLGRILVP